MDDPKKFVKADVLPRRDTSDLMKEFHEEVKAMHGRVIDIGCGPGTTTKELVLPYLPADAVVVGADISPEMVKYAEQHNKHEKRMSFLQLNIETLDLPIEFIENYDSVMSFFCLHWCKKTDIMLNNIYKLLRPGGTGLVLFLSDTTPFELQLKYQNNTKYSVYMENAASIVPPLYGSPNPEKLLQKDLEKAGFEVLHCSNRKKTFAFEKLNIFLDALMSITPFFNQMPEDLQRDYRNDVARHIKRKYSIDENDVNANELPVVEKYASLVAYFKKPIRA